MTAPADVWAHICLARVPDAEGGRAECSQTVPCPDHGDSYSSGKPAEPPRDDVGELRECVRELVKVVKWLGNREGHIIAEMECDDIENRLDALRKDRLAAPGQGGAT